MQGQWGGVRGALEGSSCREGISGGRVGSGVRGSWSIACLCCLRICSRLLTCLILLAGFLGVLLCGEEGGGGQRWRRVSWA